MGYFPVRYDSRVINYDRTGFIRLATGQLWGKECSSLGGSPGLVVKGGDSRLRGRGFESQY